MLKRQTWDLLEKSLPEKKIVIFGASIFASLLFFAISEFGYSNGDR